MDVLLILLLIFAAICFALAAFGVASRINLIGAGLFLWVLTELIPAAQRIT